MAARRAGQKVLVFRMGALGDTLVAMPALWGVRRHFAGARVSLLCDVRAGQNYVAASDLLAGGGVVDDFVPYPVPRTLLGRWLRPFRMLGLAMRLRARGYDAVVYLSASGRTAAQVRRDRAFFRLAGVGRVIGMDVGMSLPDQRTMPRPLPVLPREMDLLAGRMRESGVPEAVVEAGTLGLGLGEAERREVDGWVAGMRADGGRRWVAVAPGSKMAAKRWPVERYRDVVGRLIERHDIWPVVFGGPEDRAVGEDLLGAWGRGYNAAGALGLRASASAISRCAIYLGNDTGTMHMAASVGVRCAAVFCSRNFPGLWNPAGEGHRLFRTQIECEGCMLQVCVERGTECIMRIGVDEVAAGCAAMLGNPGG